MPNQLYSFKEDQDQEKTRVGPQHHTAQFGKSDFPSKPVTAPKAIGKEIEYFFRFGYETFLVVKQHSVIMIIEDRQFQFYRPLSTRAQLLFPNSTTNYMCLTVSEIIMKKIKTSRNWISKKHSKCYCKNAKILMDAERMWLSS